MCSLSSETKIKVSLFQIWSTHCTLIDLLPHILEWRLGMGSRGFPDSKGFRTVGGSGQ